MDISLFDFCILGFGGFFCVVWAIGLSLPKSETKWAPTFFVGSSGLRLLWEAYTHSGLVNFYPEMYAFPVPILYAIGPIIFFYYKELSGQLSWKWNIYHFLPIGFSVLPLFYWIQLNFDEKLLCTSSILNGNWNFPYGILIFWIIGPKVSILIYAFIISSGKSGTSAWAIQFLPKKVRFFSSSLLFYIFVMISGDILGYVIGEKKLYVFSAWSHSFASILVYLYSKYNPSVMLEISGAIKTARYSNSKLIGIDYKEALVKLNNLLTNKAYYADENLRLPTLAEAMMMSSHQLSELINVNFQMSFVQYVNSHRVLIAIKMLEQEKMNILSIAFSVGFNSKSAFNRVFRQLMGNSPREFRKNPKHFVNEKSILLKKIYPIL